MICYLQILRTDGLAKETRFNDFPLAVAVARTYLDDLEFIETLKVVDDDRRLLWAWERGGGERTTTANAAV